MLIYTLCLLAKKRITLPEDFYFVALPSKRLLLIWPLRECLHKLRAKTARPAIPAKICNREKKSTSDYACLEYITQA